MEKVLAGIHEETETLKSNLETESDKKENFSEIIGNLHRLDSIIRYSGSVINWSDFRQKCDNYSYDFEQCSALLAGRKTWLEIMENGEKFQNFFEEQISKLADSKLDHIKLYNMVNVYRGLNFKNSVHFFNTLLDSDGVWNQEDGSTRNDVIGYLKNNGDENTPQSLIRFLRNIYSEDYVRKKHIEGDAYSAISALVDIVGKNSAVELLKPFVEKNQNFAQLISQVEYDGIYRNFAEHVEVRDVIDVDVEHQRIRDLEHELEEIRINPRIPPQPPAFVRGGWSNPFEENFDDEWDYIDDLKSEPPHFDLDSKTLERAERVNRLVIENNIAPTASSAARLHMFNFISAKPNVTEEEIQSEFKKVNILSEREMVCGEIKNPLPTIGIEIEIPDTALTPEKVAVLDALDISNYKEGLDNLWEVNPDFSYSAGVQARVIQELGHLGALPINSGTGKVDEKTPLSLHLNFGMPVIPGKKGYLEKYRERMYLISDLIAYGYTSFERLNNRKTNNSLRLSGDASESKKQIEDAEDKIKSSPEESNLMRMELRATEFKDYPTFRMLVEAQRVVAMLAPYIKYKQKIEITFVEACLADLWTEFEAEVSEYLYREGLDSNGIDDSRELPSILDALQTTDLKVWSRFLISDYSRKVNQIIKEATPLF